MRHGVKKIKIGRGRDATRMLVKKLAVNFIRHGKLVTTIRRARVLKSTIETLVEKAKVQSQANQNVLLATLGDWSLVQMVFKNVGTALKDKAGGYVRLVRLGARSADGAEVARVEWAYPVVMEQEVKKPAVKAETVTKQVTTPKKKKA